jgi:hypothetical protein
VQCRNVFNWEGITINDQNSCSQHKANIAFAFLSAIVWLVSAILGIYWVRRHTRTYHSTVPAGTPYRRRRWYRSRV